MNIQVPGLKEKIRRAGKERVQNLACSIDADLLKAIHVNMDGKKAVGINKVTKAEYGKNLECLVRQMKRDSYKPNPARRVYIEKDGSSKKRPLVLSSYENKLVQVAVAL